MRLPLVWSDVAELIAQFDVEGGDGYPGVLLTFLSRDGYSGHCGHDFFGAFRFAGGSADPLRGQGRGVRGCAVRGAGSSPAAIGRLVVIAPPSMFAEIEKLLVVLRHDVNTGPPVVEFIAVQYADPDAGRCDQTDPGNQGPRVGDRGRTG